MHNNYGYWLVTIMKSIFALIACFICSIITANHQSLLNELSLEEKSVWQELAQMGINKQNIRSLQRIRRQEYINCRKELENRALKRPFSALFMQRILSALQDFNINQNSISIIRYSDPESIANATDFQLFIDEDALSQFPLEAQEFLIAHEIQHLIQQDDSERFFIYQQLSPTLEQLNNSTFIINKLYRFQEKRADVLASIKKTRYAQGHRAYAQRLFEIGGRDSEGITHPTETIRIALALLILNAFSKDQGLKA